LDIGKRWKSGDQGLIISLHLIFSQQQQYQY